MSYFEFPHTRTYEGDLGYIIKKIMELTENYNQFFAYNSIKFADPIEWDITTQYAPYTIVFDTNDEYSYISKKPVPAGITLDNTDYWEVLGSMLVDGEARAEIDRILNFIANVVETGPNASANRNAGDFFIMGGYLWQTLTPVYQNELYVEDVNIKKTTIEDMVRYITSDVLSVDTTLNILSNNPIANKTVAIKFIDVMTDIAALSSRIDDVEGDITTLNQSVNGLSSDIGTVNQGLTSETSNREAADAYINARIDNIVALPSGSTQGDAELMDIRTAYNGRVFSSAGDSVRGQVSNLEKEVAYISENTVMDYASILGWTPGILDNNGAVTPDSSFTSLADYIPVTPGDILHFLNNNPSYTMIRCTYDSTKTLINRSSVNPNNNDYAFGIESGVAYVRIAVSYGQVNNYQIYNESTSITYLDTVRKQYMDETLDRLSGSVQCEDLGYKYGWRPEVLNTTTGAVTINFDYRCTDFIPVIEGQLLTLNLPDVASYTLFRALYDENKNFISGTPINVTEHVRTYAPTPSVKYVKYCISAVAYNVGRVLLYYKNDINNNALYLDVAPHDRTFFNYQGRPLDLDIKNKFTISKLIPYADTEVNVGAESGQGIVIYNDILFQFIDTDKVRLYDISKRGECVGMFTVPNSGHGNTACFSNDFYNVGDEFPLLYVSDIDGHVRMYRITRSNAVLIQILYFDPAVYGQAPQFALDPDNNIGYVLGADNTVTFTEGTITSCDMTDLIDNGDGTLTPSTIDSYTVSMPGIAMTLQGFKYLNDTLYIPSGSYDPTVKSSLITVSTVYKNISNVIIDLPTEILDNELEDIAFYMPANGDKYNIILHVRTVGYFRMIL